MRPIRLLLCLIFIVSCVTGEIRGNDSNGNSPMHDAVFSGDIGLVRSLIKNGADVNSENEQCVTPVRLAAYMGRGDIVKALIVGGVDLNYGIGECRSRSAGLFGDNILKYPEKQRNFFLTFDAGGDNTNMRYILDLLDEYHIKATFFITGEFIKKYPDDVRRIARSGHTVGNHTLTHAAVYRNEDHLLNELFETEVLYKNLTGVEMARIWRAPYLAHIDSSWMLRSARKLGYRHVDVSFYSKDWVPEGEKLYLSNEKFIELFRNSIDFNNINRAGVDGDNYRMFRKRSTDYRGVIMLMHSGRLRTRGTDFVFNLENVILQLISCGYYFDNCKKFED